MTSDQFFCSNAQPQGSHPGSKRCKFLIPGSLLLVKRTQRTIKSPYHGQTCNVKSPSYAGSQNGTTARAKQARPSKWSLDCVEQIFDTSSKERLLVMFPALSILASFAAINSKDSHFRPLLSTSHTTFISCISKIHDKHFSIT